MTRLCCRDRRTRGAEDFTETTLMPALERAAAAADTTELDLAELEAYGDRRGRRAGDQLAALPPGALEAALGEAGAAVPGTGRPADGPEDSTAYRRPVPRRPWRRVWCWFGLGHFWFPDVPECLDCGAPRVRARWRGDR